jgi:uroporphyrinogen-III synthase
MPEHKINILCTRPLNLLLVDKAAEQGIVLDIISFIETRAIVHEDLKMKIAALADQPAIVVFTSLHAIEAILPWLKNKKPSWKIFCLEGRTKKSAAVNFGEGRIAGSAKSANGLADLIIEQKQITEIVFFCGNQKREELPGRLAERNIKVNEMTVYETIPRPTAIAKDYDGILFFSPSAVKSFFSVNRTREKTILFAIGNTTANSIKAYSKNTVSISEYPDEEMLINQVIDYFKVSGGWPVVSIED